MYRQVGDLKTNENHIAYKGLLIRHLVMPQNLARTDKIMEFIANELSINTYVNIMAQYYPEYKAFEYEEISKQISDKEFQYAIDAAKAAGLTNIR